MKRLALVLAFALVSSSVYAQGTHIPSADERLAMQIANLMLQLSRAGEQLETQKQTIDELQARLQPKPAQTQPEK